jgi:hypothetical protein
VDCRHLAEDRDQWRPFLKTVMNFESHKGGEGFLDQLSD